MALLTAALPGASRHATRRRKIRPRPAAPAQAQPVTRRMRPRTASHRSRRRCRAEICGCRWDRTIPMESRGFRTCIGPYTPIDVPEPPLTNTPRISQLIQNGQLMLSLEDAISLALENNLDIAVQRFTPWLDEANLLFAKSGANCG